ncbi:MAG: 2-amino-4-hydroxy-6-hydroxymethyldihydropteridine diphosphokinase [Melioribacteraceae bacterium]|nr:2-amino-4-hydroxy-6-hydroxymethyldihydropteridine diphosphokinase [Melioribacteraceae bacterium]
MNNVYLGLGSNVGVREENIRQVIDFFCNDNRFVNVKISSLYETIPYGEIKQENFINGVLFFQTNITFELLFDITKSLERKIGRIKRKTWGPREIDIDILLFGDFIINNEKISIPHKDLLNRDFVIVPLLELNNELIHPIQKKKIKSFLSELNDKYIIGKINFSYSHNKFVGIT